MDPQDPRDPRNRKPGGGLGDAPGELYGQLPGLIGATGREDYLREHPEAAGGFPQMPAPPPYPTAVPPEWLEQQACIYAQVFLGVFGSRYIRDYLATTLQSWERQYFRPVHLPPWVTFPFRAVPIGGVSAFVGTTVLSDAATWTTIVSDTVPDGMQGRIKWLGQGVGAVGDWANLNWRVVHGVGANLVPYRTPFATWQHQIGQIEAPTEVEALIVGEGETVALQANQASGASITGVMGLLRGWMWPRTGGVTDGAAGSIVV